MIKKRERARNEPFPQEGFVTDEQIAYFVGIHVATVWVWVKNGRLPPPLKFSAGTTRWNATAVRKFLLGEEVLFREQ